ncbi:MAG: ATP-binding protein, partial [Trebonia sp.]
MLTLGEQRDNFPAEVTRFIGRRRELPAVAEAIERHRLVTLRGVGGVGKTRLALRTAVGLRDSFADGCWFVQLSPLHAPELLARTVSETLGLPGEAAGDAPRALAENLREHELLLILDTCEHLTGACAELAALLLSAVPGLRVLATSRAPLGLPEEHSLLIAPLELPSDVATAAYTDAVTLFVDRARAAVPDFALTPQNIPAVAELCSRLDGIPLAIELAAVRVRSMPVEAILDRLSDRFRVLGTTRTATGRHRTLRAAVSWSYELCSPAEQRLWAALSVFPGGFRLAAAEHVCGPDTSETLARLVEKSVVLLSPGGATPRTPQLPPGGATSRTPRGTADLEAVMADIGALTEDRYHLLDTLREFGAEHLAAAEARQLRARHRDYYLGLAERAAASGMTAEQPAWLAKLAVETANLRVALDYCFSVPGEAPAGLRMTRLLLPYWLMTG